MMLCPAENAAMNSGVLKQTNLFVSARKVWQKACEMISAEEVTEDQLSDFKMAKVMLTRTHCYEDVPFPVCFFFRSFLL